MLSLQGELVAVSDLPVVTRPSQLSPVVGLGGSLNGHAHVVVVLDDLAGAAHHRPGEQDSEHHDERVL